MTPARRTLVGVLLGLAFAAALVLATLRETGVRCEACVDFGGRRECRAVSGANREKATEQALATACALLARGVTQAFECQRTPPSTVECDD